MSENSPQGAYKPAEVVDGSQATPEHSKRVWEAKVRQRYRDRCANCGGSERLKVRLVIPRSAGGRIKASNGVLLCRACEMAGEAVSGSSRKDKSRPVNFYVSRDLNGRIARGLATHNGFHSKSALIRYLMGKYEADEDLFDDLELFQDSESSESVKINVWVDNRLYRRFKDRVNARGLTVTDALKGLLLVYSGQVEPRVERMS